MKEGYNNNNLVGTLEMAVWLKTAEGKGLNGRKDYPMAKSHCQPCFSG